jgi:hypothetical protein
VRMLPNRVDQTTHELNIATLFVEYLVRRQTIGGRDPQEPARLLDGEKPPARTPSLGVRWLKNLSIERARRDRMEFGDRTVTRDPPSGHQALRNYLGDTLGH